MIIMNIITSCLNSTQQLEAPLQDQTVSSEGPVELGNPEITPEDMVELSKEFDNLDIETPPSPVPNTQKDAYDIENVRIQQFDKSLERNPLTPGDFVRLYYRSTPYDTKRLDGVLLENTRVDGSRICDDSENSGAQPVQVMDGYVMASARYLPCLPQDDSCIQKAKTELENKIVCAPYVYSQYPKSIQSIQLSSGYLVANNFTYELDGTDHTQATFEFDVLEGDPQTGYYSVHHKGTAGFSEEISKNVDSETDPMKTFDDIIYTEVDHPEFCQHHKSKTPQKLEVKMFPSQLGVYSALFVE